MEKESLDPAVLPESRPARPSWQARGLSASIRLFIRRRRWGGDALAVARRARRIFGAPWPYRWLRTRGLNVRRVDEAGIRGEWLEPASAAGDGVIFYLHGGGFVSCSAATQRPVTTALARLTGLRVFSLDYRLAPEHRYPAALDDAFAAYEWLLAREGARAGAICVAGDSAGGGLALGCLLRVRDAGLAPPACAVCFSPWTDLAGTGASVRGNDGRCAMFHTENIEEFAAAYLPPGASPRDPYASPAHADLGGLPPVLLQVGSTELLLDDARAVHDKLREAGGASRLEIYEDLPHGWQMLDGFVPEARAALRQAASFIRERLRAAAGDASQL
jgi:acetyl esterase/lipase